MEAETYAVIKRGWLGCVLKRKIEPGLHNSPQASTSSGTPSNPNANDLMLGFDSSDEDDHKGKNSNEKGDKKKKHDKLSPGMRIFRPAPPEDDNDAPPAYDDDYENEPIESGSDEKTEEHGDEPEIDPNEIEFSISTSMRRMTLFKGDCKNGGTEITSCERPKLFSSKMHIHDRETEGSDVQMKRSINRWKLTSRRTFELGDGTAYEWDITCIGGHQTLTNVETGQIIAIFKRRNFSYRNRGTLRLYKPDQISPMLRRLVFVTSHQMYLEESARRRRRQAAAAGGGGGGGGGG